MRSTRSIALALLLLLPGAAVNARPAKPPRKEKAHLPEARAAVKAAAAAFDAGRFEEARAGFERALELSHSPILYFNLAACAEKLGQERVAVAHLRAYLTEVPGAEDEAQVRERIGKLEERARQTELRTQEEERAEERARQQKNAVAPAPAPTPAAVVTAAPAAARVPSVGRRYAGGFAGLALTLAFGGVGVGLGTGALLDYRALERECGGAGCAAERVDAVSRQALVADLFYGLTGAAALTTVILIAVEARRSKPAVAAGGGGGR